MAKELNLAIYCLLGSPATDATINPPYYVKVQLEVIAPFYDLDNAKKKRGCLKSWDSIQHFTCFVKLLTTTPLNFLQSLKQAVVIKG